MICYTVTTVIHKIMQINVSQVEEALKILVELSPNKISNIQRLDLLMSAYLKQKATSNITITFIKVIEQYHACTACVLEINYVSFTDNP